MPNGNVTITIADGGSAAVVLPSQEVQLIIGCCSGGTANQIVPTANPNTLVTSLGWGPLVEAAALVCQSGATVLAMKAATNSAGACGAVQSTVSGTCVVTASGAAYDDYYVELVVLNGGTIGTAGITFQVSIDAGRNFGPTLSLGATSYTIPNTNVTINFGSGTLLAGDSVKFATTAPHWNDAGVQACITAFQASQYAVQGVGSALLVGYCAGADASTIGGYLDTLAAGYVYLRLMVNARDALAPAAWAGGSGEAETVWMSSIETDYSAVSARRICASGGHYNMPSAFANPTAGSPRFRRPKSWALAARETTIPPQRHAGRVKDGPYSQIVIDPINDPKDGFVYHDERLTPGLDGARFSSARTRIGLPGFYEVNPNLMSPAGSQFTILPLGNVLDETCDIVTFTAQQELNEDVRLNPNGTIYVNDALSIQATINAALTANLVATKIASAATATVDQSWNVQSTSIVKIVVAVQQRGYIDEVDVLVGFVQPNQAGG